MIIEQTKYSNERNAESTISHAHFSFIFFFNHVSFTQLNAKNKYRLNHLTTQCNHSIEINKLSATSKAHLRKAKNFFHPTAQLESIYQNVHTEEIQFRIWVFIFTLHFNFYRRVQIAGYLMCSHWVIFRSRPSQMNPKV